MRNWCHSRCLQLRIKYKCETSLLSNYIFINQSISYVQLRVLQPEKIYIFYTESVVIQWIIFTMWVKFCKVIYMWIFHILSHLTEALSQSRKTFDLNIFKLFWLHVSMRFCGRLNKDLKKYIVNIRSDQPNVLPKRNYPPKCFLLISKSEDFF